MNEVYFIIGLNIKRIRKERGLTQEELAELSFYSLSFIGNLESKKVYQTISIGTLYHLSKVLDVDIREFFEGVEKIL